MKLRNLLFGTMIACAFASCSNDDDPIDNGGGNTNLNGKTLLRVSSDVLKTKAATDPFTICVIDANGLVVATGNAEDVFELPANAEGNVEIVALKNSPVDIVINTTTKTDLTSLIDFSSEEEVIGNESMNTAYFAVSVERGKLNTLGYTQEESEAIAESKGIDSEIKVLNSSFTEPIPAYRNVAKIFMESILLANTDAFHAKYPNATFTPKEMYLVNGKSNSYLSVAGATRWAKTENVTGTSYLGGFTSGEYDTYYEEAEKIDADKMYVKTKPGTYTNYVAQGWENLDILHQGYARDLKSEGDYVTLPLTSKTNDNPRKHQPGGVSVFWTYENSNENTPVLLIVKGDFTYDDAVTGDAITASDRFYTIVVGQNVSAVTDLKPTDFGYNTVEELLASFSLVRRNIQYAISLTVAGPGSINPFIPGSEEDTYMDAVVELMNYGAVRQDETID